MESLTLRQRLARLLCQRYGHQLLEGLRYRNPAGQICYSLICQRCGEFNKTVIEDASPDSTCAPELN